MREEGEAEGGRKVCSLSYFTHSFYTFSCVNKKKSAVSEDKKQEVLVLNKQETEGSDSLL